MEKEEKKAMQIYILPILRSYIHFVPAHLLFYFPAREANATRICLSRVATFHECITRVARDIWKFCPKTGNVSLSEDASLPLPFAEMANI